MTLPKVFDKAKNEAYAGGYERRFKRERCNECKFFMKIDKYEGCNAKGYSIPLIGTTGKYCSDFIREKDISPQEFYKYVVAALGRELTENERRFIEHIGGNLAEWEQRNVLGNIFKEIAEKQ